MRGIELDEARLIVSRRMKDKMAKAKINIRFDARDMLIRIR
jgi:hypothetical protein